MKIPLALAEKAIEHKGRKFLLIQAATLVEVEGSADAGSPSVVNGMVVFHDSDKPPVTAGAQLGITLPSWNTAVVMPWVSSGATVEEQMAEGTKQIREHLDRLTKDD